MTKKNAILITMVVIAIALVVVAFLTFFSGEEKEEENTINLPTEQTFFPISNNDKNEVGDELEETTVPLNEFNIPRLRQIANVPVAGFTVFERKATTSNVLVSEDGKESFEEITDTVYRYIERATGHIYETTARSLDIERITNTTIPKVYNAEFSLGGENVVLQYLNENNQVETFVANVVKPEPISNGTSTEEIVLPESNFMKLEGSFLPDNVSSFDKSPNQKDIFYLRQELDENFIIRGVGYLTSFISPEKQKSFLSSPASEWQINWPNENIVTFVNNSSSQTSGFLYFLNLNNNAFTKILGGFDGFNALVNSKLTRILYTENSQNKPNLYVYDLEKKESYNLDFGTFIEKCVWGNKNPEKAYCGAPRQLDSANYPDDWYQGKISFSDSLAVIDWSENTVDEVSGLTIPFDIIKPKLSQNDDYFVFVNKKDLTLWSLDLNI